MTIIGTSGNDTLTGTSGNDLFQMFQGGDDTVSGLAGNDVFQYGATLTSADAIDGGSGNDVVQLKGDYSAGVIFSATTMVNVEKIQFGAGFDYNLTSNDANVASGQTLTLDASALGAGNALTFDGSAETDGAFVFIGGAGDDHLTGGAGNDIFELSKGGEDTASGGAGKDVFIMGASFDAGDRLDGGFDGGTPANVLRLDGDYSAGVTLGPDTIQNIYTLQFDAGHDYKIIADADSFLSGPPVLIEGQNLGAGNTLNFDGSASDANMHFIGGAGNDVLTGGDAQNTFDLSHGGNDTATGGALTDYFTMGSAFTAADKIDGGAGNDVVLLDGMGAQDSITFSATTMVNVESLQLEAGHSYNLTTNDATVAAGATLIVDASALGASKALTFDGSAETDGHFIIRGGAGNDVLTGGQDGDTFNLTKGGNDTVTGGAGDDTVNMGATLTAADHLNGGGSVFFNTVTLDGDYSAGLTLGATTLVNFDYLKLDGGYSYNLTTNDATVASGNEMTVDAYTLGTDDTLIFNGAAETDGNFSFEFGAGFTAADQLTGSSNVGGNDALGLDGDYTGAHALVFTATTLHDVGAITVNAGHSYDITTNDANVAAGALMVVDGQTLGASDTLTFNGSAETDGRFQIIGGAGDDSLTGGAGNDIIDITAGGDDTVNGGAGNDTIDAGAAFGSGDQIDGGAGSDTLSLDGTYASAITVSGTMVQNVESVTLAGSGYNITWQSAIASGLTVDASAIGSGNSVIFDDSALASGNVHLIAGAGDTVFRGGGGDDVVDLQNSTDGFNVSGGDGDDTVNFGAVYGSNPFQAADGGTGSNTATFDGDYSSGVTVGPSFFFIPIGLRDFQTIELLGGHSYGLNFDDSHGSGATLTGGAALTVDASALGAGDQAYLDFSLSQASGFTVTGGAGDDDFTFAANFSASDTIDGGAGSDTLELNGDYSAGLTFGAATMTNVETLQLDDGFSYNLTTNDATVASGATLTVDASALTGTNALTFDGSAETDGFFAITGGAGNDTVKYAKNLSASDTFDGGAGNDTLEIGGTSASALTFNANTMTNVETLKIDGSVNIILNDGNVAAGATLTVDASAAGDLLHVNGSAETDGAFDFIAGTNIADFIGGAGSDSFDMSTEPFGVGTEQGNGGDDTFLYAANFNNERSVVEGGAGSDTLELNGAYTSLGITATGVTSVETLTFLGGHSYTGVTVTGDIAAGSTLNIDASAAGNLSLDLSAATSAGYAVTGSAGDDTITFGSNFSVSDAIDGGAGSDTVNLVNVSGTYTFAATTIANVEDLAITVTDGDSASFTTNDANVAAGATMIVDFSSSGPEFGIGTLTFDGSAETDGHFAFIEPDFVTLLTLTGGALSDTFSFIHGDGGYSNTFNGLGGDDTATTTVNAGSLVFNGGTGSDTLAFTGGGTENTNYYFTSVENVKFDDNNWIVNERFATSPSASLNIDATALSGGHTITFNGIDSVDGSNTANASFVFEFAGNFISGDSLTGSNNNDTLSLNGDYSSGTTFGAAQLTSIEDITLADGHTYSFTENDGNVASGATLTVDASALTGSNQLFFDGSAETDGHFAFIGGAGDDDLEGGAQSDTFDLSRSDGAFAYGNGGDDVFTVTSRAFLLDDSIDGGAGSDTLVLDGDFSASTTLSASNITSIETLQLGAGHSYDLISTDPIVASGQTLTVDASALGAGDTFSFDGSAETDGSFIIDDGGSNGTIITSRHGDTVTFLGGDSNSVTAGHDTGANVDTFDFGSSTNTTMVDGPNLYDVTIDNFSQSAGDRIHLTGSDTASYAIAHQIDSGGNTQITLNDESTIHLIGVASINTSFFD